ncbi:MAG: gamma-glutamyl-gamma-aminobutyrate hydrolase family protein [Gemmatimonadota bacterium]
MPRDAPAPSREDPLQQHPIRVAVTASVEAGAGSHKRPAIFLYTSYIHALEQIGLAPVLITPSHSPAAIAALMDVSCGLVLSGGEDVDPARYGEEPSPALGSVAPARDEMEFRALGCAIERRMPVFGICRGAQVLNVHFGGTLYQDIGTERPGDLIHEQTEPWDKRSHPASVASDSMLCDIVGTEQLHINSFHHQAVKDIGDGLRVVARAADGLVEAIEHENYPWLLGVQWHPERNEAAAPASDPDRLLFLALREAVHRYARVPARVEVG